MQVIKTTKAFLSKNSPVIAMSIGAVAGISSVVMAVKNTPKAITQLDLKAYAKYAGEIKENEEDSQSYLDWLNVSDRLSSPEAYFQKLTKKEIVQATWLCYLPSAILMTMSIGCFLAAFKITNGRAAAISSAYAIGQRALDEYQHEVLNILTKDQKKELQHNLNEKALAKTEVPNDSKLIIFGKGDTLVFDELSGRYFLSDKETIRTAVNDFNQQIIWGSTQDLNDWYRILGLDDILIGEILGWNSDRMMDISFESMVAPNGEPCLVLNYLVPPSPNYRS